MTNQDFIKNNILLIEDDEGDQILIKHIIEERKQICGLYIVENGEEAFDFLLVRGKYKNNLIRPDLIILDLNLPKMNGKEFLMEIKKNNALSIIPVIILSTSDYNKDIVECYNLHVSGYFVKSIHLTELTKIVNAICDYWFNYCRLPNAETTAIV